MKNSTINNWLARLTTNAPARLNWPTEDTKHNVFFKVNSRQLRLYNKLLDPPPISHEKFTHTNNDIYIDINEINVDSNISSTEKEQLVKSRIGQGLFRKNVIDTWGHGEICAVTKINITEILIASHIKPWSLCETKSERLDGANGILLCSHLDKLFDNHLISFKKKNSEYLLVIKSIHEKILKEIGICNNMPLDTSKIRQKELNRFDQHINYHYKIFSKI